ncbi:MAG: O-antigen polymerase [Phycisphaerae bacterium]
MEHDFFMVMSGIALTMVALVAWFICLTRPRAMLLDPISLGWGGFIAFVALAILLLGWFEPFRSFADGKEKVVGLVVLGLVGYVAGLLCGGTHRKLASLVPTPRDTLNLPMVWTLTGISIVLYLFGVLATMFYSEEFLRVPLAFATAGLGAAGVLSVLLMTAFKSDTINKILGAIIFIAVILVLSYTQFSRRPVPGLLGALVAMVYHLHIRRKAVFARLMFLAGSAGVILLVILFLTATRGSRIKGTDAVGTFSDKTRQSFIGGITVNVNAFEFCTITYPEYYDYLWGSGMLPVLVWPIPRAIWEDKPLPTGGVISPQYTGKDSYSVANTFFGEAFVNFGTVGVPICLFVVGIIVGTMTHKLRSDPDNLTLWVAWFTIAPDYIGEWRGDLTSMTVQAVVRVSFFLFMTWLLGKFFGRARRTALPRSAAAAPAGPRRVVQARAQYAVAPQRGVR